VVVDQRLGVVEQQLVRHAAEVVEGVFQALQPRRLALVQEHAHVAAAAVAERRHEEVNALDLLADGHAGAAEVDLQLLAGRGLEAYGGERFGAQRPAQRLDRALHGAKTDRDAELALEVLAHDVGVAAVSAQSLRQPLAVRLHDAGSAAHVHRLPAAAAQILAHGVAAAA